MAVYETPRLVVRAWTHDESDVDRIFDTYSRWEVARWLGATPRVLGSREEAETVVDRWAGRGDDDDRFGVWAIEVRDTGVVAGTVLLVTLPDPGGTGAGSGSGSGLGSGDVEVGWHLHPDSWGYGYATEAARGAIEWGFAGGLEEILAVVRPDNERSLAVCRRLGMTPLGLTDRWYDSELELFRAARG